MTPLAREPVSDMILTAGVMSIGGIRSCTHIADGSTGFVCLRCKRSFEDPILCADCFADHQALHATTCDRCHEPLENGVAIDQRAEGGDGTPIEFSLLWVPRPTVNENAQLAELHIVGQVCGDCFVNDYWRR